MDYAAPWWLPGGHLQTIWPAMFARRTFGPAPVYRRERWTAPDGDFIDLDWLVSFRLPTGPGGFTEEEAGEPTGASTGSARTDGDAQPPSDRTEAGEHTGASTGSARTDGQAQPPSYRTEAGERAGASTGAERTGPHAQPLSDRTEARPLSVRTEPVEVRPARPAPPKGHGRPLLVLFHGLEGSSRSHYAEAFADFAAARGIDFVVPHFRGCSGELNAGPRAYHSGDHEEIAWILGRLRAAREGPLLAVGVSLGGNALMRWAGEWGERASQLASAVAAVCSPLDLAAGGRAIGEGFSRLVYTTMFLRSMKPKAMLKLAQHPELFDQQALLAARDLYEFDNVFTAPLHGFRDTDDYWSRASAKPHLHRVRIPALLLNAGNDPFVPAASLPGPPDVSDRVTLWQPREGGHVGFPSPTWPAHVRTMPEAVGGWLLQRLG